MKILNVKKRIILIDIFCENHPLTRHIKYIVIDFGTTNK